MHGLNEGHIAPYTDIENSAENSTHIAIKSMVNLLQIFEDTDTIGNNKTGKKNGTKTKFHNRINQGCVIKRQNKSTSLQYT